MVAQLIFVAQLVEEIVGYFGVVAAAVVVVAVEVVFDATVVKLTAVAFVAVFVAIAVVDEVLELEVVHALLVD